MNAQPLLSVQNLVVAFGSHPAVNGLSFDVHPGETLALVGESGSGKSATALSILRLIEREGGAIRGGRILLHGQDGPLDLAQADEAALRRVRGNRVSMVFQEPMTALNPVMRLGEQVAEVIRLHQGLSPAAARQAALAAFQKVRIPMAEQRLDQYPHELSGGLRQRVMIAMALACRPALLIADEPTTALDVTTQAGILELIRDLQTETGMAVLLITHDMGVVAEMADRVVVLRHGEMAETAAVNRIFAAPQAAYTRALMAATPRLGAGAPKLARPSAPVLEINDLRVEFALPRRPFARAMAYHAVNGVSLTVGAGETLGLVGESGCGKSTLARAALRLTPHAGGSIRLEGREIGDLDERAMRPLRPRAQMVFQDPQASLNPRLPVHRLIAEPAEIAGLIRPADSRDLAADLLQRVGLGRDAVDRYPHQFSGGQRQRICIARALSVKPALIVADEAVSALDVSVARQVTDLIADLQARDGLSFLFISHDLAVVERVSHRIAIMLAGQIVETGPTDMVLADPRHAYTRQLLAAAPVPDPARRGRFRPQAGAVIRPDLVYPRGQGPERLTLTEVAPGHWVAGGAPRPAAAAATAKLLERV